MTSRSDALTRQPSRQYAEATRLLPEFRDIQRARVVLDYTEGQEHGHAADTGWAQIDGPWLHWLADDPNLGDAWQTWPMHNVLCIDWERPHVPEN